MAKKPSKAAENDYLSIDEGKYLLALARKAIEHYLDTGERMDIKPSEIPSGGRLARDGACFVTLYIGSDAELRGCIGTLEASRPLAFDVADNALNSAFGDPRFPQVRPEELKDIKIEISVLTPPRRISPASESELLSMIVPRKHGLIIQKGMARATFLPVVWDELGDKEEFLARLCMKAGLRSDEWKDVRSMEFYTYEAQEFSE